MAAKCGVADEISESISDIACLDLHIADGEANFQGETVSRKPYFDLGADIM